MHKPTPETRQKVREMIAAGVNQVDVAACIGIAYETYQRHYAEEIATAKPMIVTLVAGKLIEKALRGNVEAAKFYLNTQGRWTKQQEITLSEADQLSDEDLIRSAIDILEGFGYTVIAPASEDDDDTASDS